MSRAADLEQALTTGLEPAHLDVVDESSMHSRGAESHFKVVVVSQRFAGLPIVKRHRLVNELAAPIFAEGLHALSIFAKTPDEWTVSEGPLASPRCGGARKGDSPSGS